jgi:hypothetical protein
MTTAIENGSGARDDKGIGANSQASSHGAQRGVREATRARRPSDRLIVERGHTCRDRFRRMLGPAPETVDKGAGAL